uniref:PAS domain S-box protein n=1 Tax=Desertifilum tharense IPPAS B-1220 TaxID=1781255 RepID=A0ACD5H1A0_9CYAN
MQSEERFKSVLKNSPIVVFSQDANLQYTWVYNLPDGFEPEQVIGHYDRDLFSEAEVAQLTAIKQRVLETRQTQRVELPLTLNGQVHYFDFNIEPYGEQNGKPMGLRGVATDISDRKRIEAQLQQREAELAKAQKWAAWGVGNTSSPPNKSLGHPKPMSLQDSIQQNPPSPAEFLNYVPSPDAEILHNTIQQSLQLNQPFQLEHRFIHPNGKILWFLLKGEPVTNPQGEVLSLTNVVFDITERKQAELELESQKAFLRQIIESVPSSIFAKDIFGRYLAINQAEAARMGCQVEEAIGKSDAELLGNSAVVEQYRQIEQAVMATGEPYLSAPHSETDSQGNVCWYQVAINPFLNPQGKIQGIIGSATNITELKQIEDQLRLSEARYRSVVDNLQEAVFQTDADGRWIFLNPAWTGITGFSIEESLGTCFLDYVHPEDRQSNLNLLLPLLRRERDYCQHSIRYLTKSGGVRWLEVVARLRTDSQGNFLGTSGTLFDITERKQTEQALRHSEELFRLVFDKAPVGTGLIDTHTLKLTQVNQTYRQILGYEEAELLGKTLIDITAPEDLDADLQQMTRLLCGEISTFRMEKRFIRKDGSRVWTDLVVTLLPSHGLTSSQTLGIIQDISDRKQAEAELRKSEASLAAAQKLARIGNWQFDLFSQKISWSAEAFEIFGCDRNQPEPNYAEFLAAMPLEDAEALQARVKRTIQTGEPYEIEHRYVKADGSTIYVLGKGEIVTNIRGQYRRLIWHGDGNYAAQANRRCFARKRRKVSANG